MEEDGGCCDDAHRLADKKRSSNGKAISEVMKEVRNKIEQASNFDFLNFRISFLRLLTIYRSMHT